MAKALLLPATVFAFLSPFTVLRSQQPQRPAESATIRYTQVLFHWQPVMGAAAYKLEISRSGQVESFEDSVVYHVIANTNACIVNDGLEWGHDYMWRNMPLDAEESPVDTSQVSRFNIIEYSERLPEVETEVISEAEIQPGLTFFHFINIYLAAFDSEGNPKLLVPGRGDCQFLPNGEILCFIHDDHHIHIFRTNIDGDTLYYSPQYGRFHHELDMTPTGSYLTLRPSNRWVTNPADMPDSLQGDSLLWMGDEVVEFSENGEIIWLWNAHDHYSYKDYELAELLRVPPGGLFDWTHLNTCHFTPDGNYIYISSRHLSRITMIDYPNGNIIWNMGKDFGNGTVDFGHDLNLSYQHDPELQKNGNILLFDNHNLGPEDSSRAIEVSIDFKRNPIAQIEWQTWGDTLAYAEGDADRLANGNTLITYGRLGRIDEVNHNSEKVWSLIRHPSEDERTVTIYRSDRIPNLYPLAFTIKGPDNEDHVPDGESYFPFCINNIGHLDQAFRYNVNDTGGWFAVEGGYIEVETGGTGWLMVPGETPEGVANDTITIDVYPEVKPSLVDTWVAVIQSNPEMAIEGAPVELPTEMVLHRNFPNPFNSQTTISFVLPGHAFTILDIFDHQGRRIKKLTERNLKGGAYEFMWDGTDELNHDVASGIYYIYLKCDNAEIVNSMILLK